MRVAGWVASHPHRPIQPLDQTIKVAPPFLKSLRHNFYPLHHIEGISSHVSVHPAYLMQHLPHRVVQNAHKSYSNATEQAMAVRREVLISLLPYMSRDRVGTPEWYAHMADACTSRYTSHLPVSEFHEARARDGVRKAACPRSDPG